MLAEHAAGLIALTADPRPHHALLLDGQNEAASALLERIGGDLPGRLYVELQRHGLAEERATETPLIDLAMPRICRWSHQ